MTLAGITLILAGIGLWIAWVRAPHLVEDPLLGLQKRTPTRTWLDREGRVLWLERTYDYEWRFPVTLEEVSEPVIRVMLAAEDSGFYQHSGVDYKAALRACFQNLFAGRVISGASTLSMQLAGMTLPMEKRDWRRKWHQAALARKMEMLHSKEEILTEYLNRIPFGGKIYGIEAAARYYFGLKASELNWTEASFLCGIPQKPNRFRPDRYYDAARERQRIILQMLVRRGFFSEHEAKRILREEPLRLRDFSLPSEFERYSAAAELSHVIRYLDERDSSYRIRLTIDQEIQRSIQQLLRARLSQLPGVRDAAAVLIANSTAEVLAYIGTIDFNNPEAGQVDAARAVRSAGSALKPFIYAEGIDAGSLVAATRLQDAPLRYGNYAPGNYDGSFAGSVTAAEALSYSLNTPVIRLLEHLGVPRVQQAFIRAGLNPKPGKEGKKSDGADKKRNEARYKDKTDSEREVGLSLALGTLGHTLFDITRSYMALARSGELVQPVFLYEERGEIDSRILCPKVFLPDTCRMISLILRERPLPYTSQEIAWKTGTSNNNHDAWCFGYTEDYTLGVWFGNKSGEPSRELIGAEAAAPAVGEIFDYLYRGHPAAEWTAPELIFETTQLCAVSGLMPGPFCERREPQFTIHGLPLRSCDICNQEKKHPIKILSPAPIQYIALGRDKIRIPLTTDYQGKIYWFLNGQLIGDNLTEYEFESEHRYTLRAVPEVFPEEDSSPADVGEVIFSVIQE